MLSVPKLKILGCSGVFFLTPRISKIDIRRKPSSVNTHYNI